MSVIDKSDVHRWLFGEETISGDSRENVDNEVVERAVPGVLYLRDVLQLVVDGLDDGPLAQQNLVLRTHEHVPHIVAHARDKLYSVDEEHLEKGLADIAPVPAELTPDVLHVALVPERVAVIGIAWGNHEVEYFSAVVDDQMHSYIVLSQIHFLEQYLRCGTG